MRPTAFSARISANTGVVQRRRRCSLRAKSLKINKRFNPGVAGSALQNRGLQVRFLPGLLAKHEASRVRESRERELRWQPNSCCSGFVEGPRLASRVGGRLRKP